MKNSSKILDYLYISERRVDQLFNQIKAGETKSRVQEKEISINFGVVSASLKESDSKIEENLFRKIQIVEDRLASSGQIGDFKSNSDYFYLEHHLRYFHGNGGVLFAGIIDDYFVGMAGPDIHLKHSVAENIQSVWPQGSDIYTQVAGWGRIADHSDGEPEVQTEIVETNPPDFSGPLSVVRQGILKIMDYRENYGLHRMKILAKRHASGIDKNGKKIICASPVYVAVS